MSRSRHPGIVDNTFLMVSHGMEPIVRPAITLFQSESPQLYHIGDPLSGEVLDSSRQVRSQAYRSARKSEISNLIYFNRTWIAIWQPLVKVQSVARIGLARQGRGARRKRCGDIVDSEQRRDFVVYDDLI
jgi:hypothetical protein